MITGVIMPCILVTGVEQGKKRKKKKAPGGGHGLDHGRDGGVHHGHGRDGGA